MILYFAGAENKISFSLLNKQKARNVLVSYAGLRNKNNFDFLKHNKNNIFLDSGAFSVFTGKIDNLDVYEYINFIKDNNFKTYAGLDVIGNPEKTYENCMIMKKAGLNPIPTFHYGSDFIWLEKYCNEFDYIAIGGMAGDLKRKRKKLCNFLNKVFSISKNKKLHGFGLTSNLLLKFPFYSVDSTGWLSAARHRTVALFKNGKLKMAEAMSKPNYSRTKKDIDDFLITNKKYDTLCEISILEYLKFEKYLTRLWEKRGIKWE